MHRRSEWKKAHSGRASTAGASGAGGTRQSVQHTHGGCGRGPLTVREIGREEAGQLEGMVQLLQADPRPPRRQHLHRHLLPALVTVMASGKHTRGRRRSRGAPGPHGSSRFKPKPPEYRRKRALPQPLLDPKPSLQYGLCAFFPVCVVLRRGSPRDAPGGPVARAPTSRPRHCRLQLTSAHGDRVQRISLHNNTGHGMGAVRGR